MRAVWPLLLLCVLGSCVAQTPAPNATAVCGDWQPRVMAEFELMLKVAVPTSSQTDDLKSFQSHNVVQLNWAMKRGDKPRVKELTTGACGLFAARVVAKLAAERASPARSLAAFLSLAAMAHLSASY